MNGKLEVIDHPKEVWVQYTYNVKERTTTACIILQEEKLDEFGCCPSPPPPVLPVSHPNQEGES